MKIEYVNQVQVKQVDTANMAFVEQYHVIEVKHSLRIRG